MAIGIFVGYLLDREIYFYEGVHLGPRLQGWLYDRWSKKYDAGKSESQLRDNEMLARPLLDAMKDIPEPFILDFATGTGRLSFALLNQPDFNGHIIALDLSQGMLEQAVAKIAGRVVPHALSGGVTEVEASWDVHLHLGQVQVSRPEARIETIGHPSVQLLRSGQASGPPRRLSNVEFLHHQSMPLPFADGTFDAVCALEVLELFPSMDEPIKELTRVLRPGGLLLTSRGTEESGRRANVKSRAVFTSLLEAHGIRDIKITPWWKLFDCVLAVKSGLSDPVHAKSLSAALRCGVCSQVEWKEEAGAWICLSCGTSLSVTPEGIILFLI